MTKKQMNIEELKTFISTLGNSFEKEHLERFKTIIETYRVFYDR